MSISWILTLNQLNPFTSIGINQHGIFLRSPCIFSDLKRDKRLVWTRFQCESWVNQRQTNTSLAPGGKREQRENNLLFAKCVTVLLVLVLVVYIDWLFDVRSWSGGTKLHKRNLINQKLWVDHFYWQQHPISNFARKPVEKQAIRIQGQLVDLFSSVVIDERTLKRLVVNEKQSISWEVNNHPSRLI